MKARLLLCLFLCGCGSSSSFPAPVPDECVTEVTPGWHRFECEGFRYDVTVPEACLRKACGLVTDVHGLSMSGRMQENNTHLSLLGKKHGYVVLQPTAQGEPPLTSWVPWEDDVKVHDFMLRLIAAFHLDTDRIHFTGFSQGGFMTWRFACSYTDLLASVAPAAAGATALSGVDACDDFNVAGCPFDEDMHPGRDLDILFMHGTKDALVDIRCAQAQRDSVISYFQMGEGEVLESDAGHSRIRYRNPRGATFEFIQHEYAAEHPLLEGHCFPGSTDTTVTEPGQAMGFACTEQNTFVWGDEVMEFFLAHPKS